MENSTHENVIYEASFNPKVKTYYVLVYVLVSAITLFGIVLTPLVALLVWIIADKQLQAMSAKLLEQKLVVKRGVFFVVEKSIPLDKITDVAMTQGPIMRWLGITALSFETAGTSAPGALVKLVGVNDASEFRETILEQKEKHANAQFGEVADVTPTTIPASELTELTHSVKRIERLLEKLVER